jgi:hypothetical protein
VDREQLLFEFDPSVSGASLREASPDAAKKENEAKRSIGYVMDAVLQFGKVSGFADLLDRVAALCVATSYSPYNALLMLLQRPAATYVLPAHQWQERYGYVIRPGEQPMVLLQRGGPVMFLLDVSQVEPGADALRLPVHLTNPYAMADVPDIGTALQWIVENAKYDGLRVTSAPLGIGFAGCVSHSQCSATQKVLVRKRPELQMQDVPVRFDVELNRSYTATEKLATLAHELGHVYCGHLGADREDRWKGRRTLSDDLKELEAESVARVVFASLAPGVELPDHLSQYFTHEPELAGVSLEAVLKAAGRVLDIAKGWGPRWKSDGPRQPATLP